MLKTIAVLKELGADAKSEIKKTGGSGLFEKVFEWNGPHTSGIKAQKALEYKEKIIEMIAGEVE